MSETKKKPAPMRFAFFIYILFVVTFMSSSKTVDTPLVFYCKLILLIGIAIGAVAWAFIYISQQSDESGRKR